MSQPHQLSPADRNRFVQLLPWFLNGTIAPQDAAFMHAALAQDPWAAHELEIESAIARATPARMRQPAGDLGLARLMAMTAPRQAPQKQAAPRWLDWLSGLLGQPRFALAAVCLLAIQSTALVWLEADSRGTDEATRSTQPSSMAAAVRVTFAPSATEAKMREALLAAGATIVSGPNQLGEYWLASEVQTLDELAQKLRAMPLVASAEVDKTPAPMRR